MSKLIALKSENPELLSYVSDSNFSNLKQQALLFDQIGFFNLSHFYRALDDVLKSFQKPDPIISNTVESIFVGLEWLQKKDIVFELKIEEELSDPQLVKTSVGQKHETAKFLLGRVLEIQTHDLRSINDRARKAELIKEQQHTLLRFMAIVMEATKGVTTVTTFPYTEYTRELPDSNKSDVTQIVISKLPLPNNETPWEQIIDYRNDPENQKNLLALRRWIRKISTEELSRVEIEEEIEWLINEFQEHMKYHKIKANTETLEVLVKTPLELIENLVKLKLSKLPEPFLAVKKRQLLLMEAEINAPGKEIAYIIKSREAFQSQE